MGVAIPRLASEYVTVYRPSGDVYAGPDTAELRAGEWCDAWVPDDHCFAMDPDGRWHAFGITHPLTSPERIHDGEFQLFHALAPQGALTETLRDGAWVDLPKALCPSERPGEILENHAPHIVERDGLYHMVYGPSPIRWASSNDLMTWTPEGALFEEPGATRDPNVLALDGRYVMLYCTEDRVGGRTSPDLVRWSEPRTVLRMPDGIAPESPFLVAHDGAYYLFVCGWDGAWDGRSVAGAYQHTTYVFRSEDPLNFAGAAVVTRLDAHAPEILRDETGRWRISSAEWPRRGVSIAALAWR